MRYHPGRFSHALLVALFLLFASTSFAVPAEPKADDSSESAAKVKVKKPHKNKIGETPRNWKSKKYIHQPKDVIEEQKAPAPKLAPRGAVNPTAPNVQTQTLSGNFLDSDGDGMTDVAEAKYGFDPNDPASFPAEPPLIAAPATHSFPLPDSGIGASYDYAELSSLVTIRWSNETANGGNYALILKNGTQTLYYGGTYWDHADVSYSRFGLNGTETLTGHFVEYGSDGSWKQTLPDFTIDLSQLSNIQAHPVQWSGNRLGYYFTGFPAENEQQYRDFLKKLLPIMYYHLGPPAEQFNVEIRNMGVDSGYFMSSEDGRVLLSDTEFIPRLIAHELVHAWKGKYLMSSNSNWDYDEQLNGFEESMAEGMAFEIMHEYVRSYPTDAASLQLLNGKPYQYWSGETTYYDSVRFKRDTTAGDFWDPNALVTDKYSTAATTFEIMQKTDPLACKQILQRYYQKINTDSAWRCSRDGLIDLWAEVVPQVNGVPLRQYLDAMPVFANTYYDPGAMVMTIIRPYGGVGDQNYAVTYANKDGQAWWGIPKSQFASFNIPSWVSWMDATPADDYFYLTTQDQPFTVSLFSGRNELLQTLSQRSEIYQDGALGYGWKQVESVAMEKFPVGLYRETVAFTDYLTHDAGAQEDRYFFGLNGLNQDSDTESVIMVGVDGVDSGTVTATVNGTAYTQPLSYGAAVFRSTEWPLDLEGSVPITVTRADGVARTYYRTLLEAGTVHNYHQTQFIIKDKDFDGVEDDIQAVTTGISATSLTFGSTGGSGNVLVRLAPGESWTAIPGDSWVSITSGATGSRKGLVYFSVQPWSGTGSRVATVAINGKSVTILQLGTADDVAPTVSLDPVATPSRATTVTISGTVTPYAEVMVTTGTASIAANVTAGTWSCTLTGLEEGAHNIVVTATARNGKSAAASTTVTVDLLPTVTLDSPSAGTISSNTVLLSYSVILGTAVVKLDGAVVAATSGDTLGPFADGPHTVRVEATDAQGNTAFSDATFIVNATSSSLYDPKSGMSWGDNTYGELGNGTGVKNTPVPVLGMNGMRAVSAGSYFTAALKTDGTVWVWGYGYDGEFGDGTTGVHSTPAQVPGLAGVEAISAQGGHVLALKSDGTVWAWGKNSSGELGDGGTTNKNIPVQVAGLSDIKAIAAGGFHSLALKSDGTVWGWGSNSYGQVGDGSGASRYQPVQVAGLGEVASIAAGYYHSLAVKADGSVWGWGGNWNGEVGDGSNTHRYAPVQVPSLTGATAVTGGRSYSLALTSGGTVWGWGGNDLGQVGDGTNTNRTLPVQVAGLTGITQVSGGYQHALAVRGDGTVWAWGGNQYGQLGNGTLTNSNLPVQVAGIDAATSVAAGYYHSLALIPYKVTGSLPGGAVGEPYSGALSASGGSAPFSWTVSAGELPPGLSLDASSGTITGVPTTGGSFAFTVQVTDATSTALTKDVSVTITVPLAITSAPLADAVVGSPYNRTLAATGGTAPYSWSITSGTLPAGLSLASTGEISGTPAAAGTFELVVQVQDAEGATAARSFSLAVYEPLAVSASLLPDGVVGSPYSQAVAAAGGRAPYAWSVTSGALPGGLTLDLSTGAISGVPAAAGTFSFTAQVADANGSTATRAYSVTVYDPLAITTTALPTGTTGSAYSATLTSTGGKAPYLWSITSGALPAGLALNAGNGAISGNPTAAATFSVTVQVADAKGTTSSKTLSLTVYAPLSISTTSLADGVTGASYSQAVVATGGTTPYAWSIVAGSLPSGLTLNPSTGVISGTPAAAGSFTVTIQVRDANGMTAAKALSISVYSPVSITTATLAGGTLGAAYSQALKAAGGKTPYAWSLVSGALPGGLALNTTTGVISGTPTVAATFTFTVKVTDGTSSTATKALSITVKKR